MILEVCILILFKNSIQIVLFDNKKCNNLDLPLIILKQLLVLSSGTKTCIICSLPNPLCRSYCWRLFHMREIGVFNVHWSTSADCPIRERLNFDFRKRYSGKKLSLIWKHHVHQVWRLWRLTNFWDVGSLHRRCPSSYLSYLCQIHKLNI